MFADRLLLNGNPQKGQYRLLRPGRPLDTGQVLVRRQAPVRNTGNDPLLHGIHHHYNRSSLFLCFLLPRGVKINRISRHETGRREGQRRHLDPRIQERQDRRRNEGAQDGAMTGNHRNGQLEHTARIGPFVDTGGDGVVHPSLDFALCHAATFFLDGGGEAFQCNADCAAIDGFGAGDFGGRGAVEGGHYLRGARVIVTGP